jgi:hypothetical protein
MLPGVETFDVSTLIENPLNVFFSCEGGAIFYDWHEPGIYEVHTNFLSTHRGRYAMKAAMQAARWMFTRTDCMTILTKVPASNRAAAMFTAAAGGEKQFERKAIWPTKDGHVDMSYWSLRYDAWINRTPELIESGRWFHHRLEEEFLRHGHFEPQHEDEECHDLHVGACVEMLKGGQPVKAVALYNRWARFAGYGVIGLVAKEPLVVNIGNAIIQVDGDNFKVIRCL